jgi:uncharacterized protein
MDEEKYKIFEIDSNKYVFFRDFVSIYKLEDDILIDFFENKGNLSEEDNQDIINMFDEANGKLEPLTFAEVPKKLDALCLITTRDCNLRCKYCYAFDSGKKGGLDMSFKIAKEAIDYLCQINPDSAGYSIVFFGGEPLMNKKLMDEVIDYCYKEIKEKRNKLLGFAMTTNGIVMNDNIAQYLKDNNFSLQVSMDGLKENHDKNRIFPNGKGSYDTIMENIKHLKRINVPFVIHSTFDPLINLFETLKELESLENPFGYGLMVDVEGASKDTTNYGKYDILALRNDYEKIIEFYLSKYLNNETIYCQNIQTCLLQIKNRMTKEIGCTSGISMISIMPDGTIIPCQNLQKLENFYEGKITDPVIEKNKNYVNNVNDNETCKKCWMKYLCGGGCYYEKYMTNGNTIDPPLSKCEVFKIQAEYFLKLYVQLEELGIMSKLEENIDNNFPVYI